MTMKPRRRPGAASLPVGAMMALTVLVIAVVLVFGAFQQESVNEQKNAEVAGRDKLLDQREASLDQRRSELDRRDDETQSQELALRDAQQALEARRSELDGQDAALKAREQALETGVQALGDKQAALDQAETDLASREQALKNAQAETDAKLSDYAELQSAVDGALGARARIASRLGEALKTAGLSAAVDADGGASLGLDSLFNESSAILTKAGQQALDAFLPVWCGALSGESLSALSVEAFAPADDAEARDLAARRAAAIVKYASDAPSLGDTVRSAFRSMALSGVRSGAEGNLAVFKFYLSSDALRKARAG
jgi:hypothetical protein